jgi:hypothetical protein
MVSHLDLPNDWAEILVETGPVVETLAKLAGALKPRYWVVGRSRCGVLSPTAGLAAAVETRSDCEVLAVPGTEEGVHHGMLARVMHRLAGDFGAPTGHAR